MGLLDANNQRSLTYTFLLLIQVSDSSFTFSLRNSCYRFEGSTLWNYM